MNAIVTIQFESSEKLRWKSTKHPPGFGEEVHGRNQRRQKPKGYLMLLRRRLGCLRQAAGESRTAGIAAGRCLAWVAEPSCGSALFGRFRCVVVMLLVVDLAAVLVLLLVCLLSLLRSKSAAVGNALVVNLLIKSGLVGIGAGCFA